MGWGTVRLVGAGGVTRDHRAEFFCREWEFSFGGRPSWIFGLIVIVILLRLVEFVLCSAEFYGSVFYGVYF
jgi:hypothetical protein